MPAHRWSDAADLLASRVSDGRYGQGALPSERRLAGELGVSYLTARKAAQHLVERGLLRRDANGRLAPAAGGSPGGAQALRAVLLRPAWAGAAQERWHRELAQVVAARGGTVRTAVWTSPDDPVLFTTLDDGAFDLVAAVLPGRPSPLLRRALIRARHRALALWHDTSDLGVVSVDALPPAAVGQLVAHLAATGCRSIDLVSTQPDDPVVAVRTAAWREALARTGLSGQAHLRPVPPFTDPATAARELGLGLLAGGRRADAWLTPTAEPLQGLLRACHEQGVRPGPDLALATCGEEERARLFVPAVTTVAGAPVAPLLARALDRLAALDRADAGPLRILPPAGILAVGESTPYRNRP